MITSGNASLREAQYHLFESKSWQADTQAQHDQMQAYFHSAGMDVVSEHNYFLEYKLAEGTLTLYEYMKHAVEVCRADGKGYFVGEFGGSTLEEYEEMCRTMMSTRVQLSLVWNFDPLGLTSTAIPRAMKRVSSSSPCSSRSMRNTRNLSRIKNLLKKPVFFPYFL